MPPLDPFQVAEIPDRLRGALRATLRGELASWPAELTAQEVRLLVDHGVGPFLYATQPLPQLRAEAMRAAAIEPLRADDLRSLLAELATRGIDVLITKGTALAYDLYAAPELRPRSDVDLLVSHDAADKAIEAMHVLGFSSHLTSGDEHGIRQLTLTRTDAFGVQHDYDVHWDVANTPLFASALRFDELLAESVAIPRLGPHARGLSRVDALLLACIHRVAHHHDSDRLIWLVDIALLRDRMSPDEHRRFWRRAADAWVIGVCKRSIELADAWMSREPHDRAEDWLSRDEIERDEPSRVFLDRTLTYGEVTLANLRALPWRERVQRVWQLAFPPPAFLRQSFGVQSRLVLPLLYVWRGARGVARLFQRVR